MAALTRSRPGPTLGVGQCSEGAPAQVRKTGTSELNGVGRRMPPRLPFGRPGERGGTGGTRLSGFIGEGPQENLVYRSSKKGAAAGEGD